MCSKPKRSSRFWRPGCRSYYPDYSVTGGYSNMGGMPAFYTFRVDRKIPLYYAHKQRAEVTEQAQAVARAQHSYQAASQSLRARITEAQRLLQVQDRMLPQFPEVATVLGVAGRAETETDPAPLSMMGTIVMLKPPGQCRKVDTWYSS